MSIHVRDYLKTHGPVLASDLSDHFRSQGVSHDAARKRVQRAKQRDGISALYSLHLPHNDSFLYLNKQYGDGTFWKSLVSALERSGSVYGHAVNGLLARGGIALKSEFAVLCGSPTFMKKQLSAERVLEHLAEIEFLRLEKISDLGEVVTFHPEFHPHFDLNAHYLRGRLAADAILHKGIKSWARRLGLVSYDSVKASTADDHPSFGQFKWNLTAPSYAHPFVERDADGSPIPGFFVADAFITPGELSEKEVRPFVRKCEIMRSQPNTRKFMGLLVAGGFAKEALQFGKNKGLLLSTPENLFGEGVGQALRELVRTISHAAEVAVENPDKVRELMDQLSRIEGAAQNLRGPLFEMIVAHCVNKREGGYVEIGQEVRHPGTGEATEIDVLASKPRADALIIECKGKKPGGAVGKDVVEDWLTRKVPRAIAYLEAQEVYRNVRKRVEIWTTGIFLPDALEYLEARRDATRKYNIAWKDGEGVLDYVRDMNATALTQTLNEHYFDHDLAF